MARPGVTEAEVFEVINSFIEMGVKVTVESIRAELGHGSPNTINRHLRTWREKLVVPIFAQSSIQVKQLKKRCADLEEGLEANASQAEKLSSLILEKDQKIDALEKALQVKEGEGAQLIKSLEASQHALEKMQAIQESSALERQTLLQALTEAHKEQAEQFRDDLKAINEMSLNQVRELSMSAQDRWLEEKIKVLDLKAEIEQLKVFNKSLEEKILGLHAGQAPLKKRIADQEKLITHCLDPKKVEAFNPTGESKE
jgi:colicin import membrane protein